MGPEFRVQALACLNLKRQPEGCTLYALSRTLPDKSADLRLTGK